MLWREGYHIPFNHVTYFTAHGVVTPQPCNCTGPPLLLLLGPPFPSPHQATYLIQHKHILLLSALTDHTSP